MSISGFEYFSSLIQMLEIYHIAYKHKLNQVKIYFRDSIGLALYAKSIRTIEFKFFFENYSIYTEYDIHSYRLSISIDIPLYVPSYFFGNEFKQFL